MIGATVGKSAGPTDNCWELIDPGSGAAVRGPIGLAGHRLGVLLTSVGQLGGGDLVEPSSRSCVNGVHHVAADRGGRSAHRPHRGARRRAGLPPA
ncbi:MAG: hypothetical protein JWO67_4250 [Streptosporangiaceae bacterium]|nr:hypothetical protein [Streptosporangiaceae bacterium]